MKKALINGGAFILIVLSLSMIVVSSYNLISMNQAEEELYEMKEKTKSQEKKLDSGTESEKVSEKDLKNQDSFFLPVPEVLQNPNLPQGCEITSLTSVLNYYGYETDLMDMAINYLPKEDFTQEKGKNYGPNPHRAYAGDPTKSAGWFCYAGPIVTAANKYFDQEKILDRAEDFSGTRRDRIIDEVNKGNPVILWVTMNYQHPKTIPGWFDKVTGMQLEVPVNSHCVVLNGFDGKDVLVMDPLKGEVRVNSDLFFESYYELGGHAVKLDRN